MAGLGLFFASVVDSRAGNARHELSEMVFIAFAAVLCGAETCVDMAAFGASKAALLRRLLDPVAFEAAFRAFMARFAAILSGRPGRPARSSHWTANPCAARSMAPSAPSRCTW